MGAALADLLVDFGARPRTAVARAAEAPSLASMPPPKPPVDVDALIAEAVALAEADVAARFSADMEMRLREAAEMHQAELDRLRTETAVEFGKRIASALDGLERKTIETTSSVVARILEQVATSAVAAKAVTALASTIRAAIQDSDTIRIRVKGPQSLFLPFASAMGDQSRHLEFSELDTIDLTVSVDEALFETRIAEWSAVLTENI